MYTQTRTCKRSHTRSPHNLGLAAPMATHAIGYSTMLHDVEVATAIHQHYETQSVMVHAPHQTTQHAL